MIFNLFMLSFLSNVFKIIAVEKGKIRSLIGLIRRVLYVSLYVFNVKLHEAKIISVNIGDFARMRYKHYKTNWSKKTLQQQFEYCSTRSRLA